MPGRAVAARVHWLDNEIMRTGVSRERPGVRDAGPALDTSRGRWGAIGGTCEKIMRLRRKPSGGPWERDQFRFGQAPGQAGKQSHANNGWDRGLSTAMPGVGMDTLERCEIDLRQHIRMAGNHGRRGGNTRGHPDSRGSRGSVPRQQRRRQDQGQGQQPQGSQVVQSASHG